MSFEKGDRVKVKEGWFDGCEGVIKTVYAGKAQVSEILTIFGRRTVVDLPVDEVEEA